MSAESDRWEWLTEQLLLRAGGRCEVTGERLRRGAFSRHHRQPRGMGGTKHVEHLADLLLVTGDGTRGAHGWMESHRVDAETRGLIVRHPLDTSEVPVTLWSGRIVLLDPGAPFYLDTHRWAADVPGPTRTEGTRR